MKITYIRAPNYLREFPETYGRQNPKGKEYQSRQNKGRPTSPKPVNPPIPDVAHIRVRPKFQPISKSKGSKKGRSPGSDKGMGKGGKEGKQENRRKKQKRWQIL